MAPIAQNEKVPSSARWAWPTIQLVKWISRLKPWIDWNGPCTQVMK